MPDIQRFGKVESQRMRETKRKKGGREKSYAESQAALKQKG